MTDLWLALAAPLSGFFATLVWQSTLWFAAGLCASRLSQRSAARGHCVLLAMTVAALLSPALTAAVARLQWGLLPAAAPAVTDRISTSTPIEPVNEPRELAARERPADVMPQPIEHGSIEHGSAPTERDAPARQPPMNSDEPTHATSAVTSAATSLRINLKTVLAAAWCCASLVLALRLVLSLRTASRLAHRAQVETQSRLLGALAEARAALMIRREFALRTSPAVRSPLIWCWGRRPIVLVAPDAAEQLEVNGAGANRAGVNWTGVNWTSVFCHELAHWVRRDHWSALWSELLVIALPWHPLAWLSRDRLSVLAEQACDDWALACGGQPVDYADSLVKLVPQPRPRTALAAVSGGRSLKLRLERVLSGRLVTPKIGGPWLTAIILVAIASAGGAAFTQHGKATPVSTAEAKPASSHEIALLPSKEANGDILTIRGRVVTPDGRPAAGAKIAMLPVYLVGKEPQPPIATVNARSDGRFEISYSAAKTNLADLRHATFLVQSPGFGAQWTRWPDIDPAKPLVLTLARDLPIRGRVIDLEGSPVAGVRVGVMGIEKTAEGNLDATLASMQSDPSGFSRKRSIPNMVDKNVAGGIPPTTTAADGRFSLSGLGAERLVGLEFQGPTIAYTTVQVATRSIVPHLPPRPLRGETNQIFAAEFILTALPTRPIVGTIRDAATGKPVPGVTVESDQFLASGFFNDVLRVKTDSNGHYELRGMPEGKGNLIQICPSDDQAYLVREVPIVPERTGLRAVTVDVQLHRAVWIQGRVTDKITGKPIAHAFVQYGPVLRNPFTFSLPEFDRSNGRRRMEGNVRYWTDADGRFRIPGLPGPALVGVSALRANYLRDIGLADIRVPVKDGLYETFGFLFLSPNGQNAIKEINPPADAREATCDLALVPGESVRLRLVDREGQPVHGCWGLNILSEGTNGSDREMDSIAEVRGLAPGETRRVWILNRDRKLGKYFELKPGNRPREMTVKLEPCATLTGRVVDDRGIGLEGIVVNANAAGIFPLSFNAVQSRTDGRFSHPYITGGCEYEVTFSTTGGVFQSENNRRIKPEAGKTSDLGEIKLTKRN